MSPLFCTELSNSNISTSTELQPENSSTDNNDEVSPLLGTTPGSFANTSGGVNVKVFSISLHNRHRRDHIRVHQAPRTVTSLIAGVISDWGGNLCETQAHHPDSSEYRLAWKAWSRHRTDTNSVQVRSLLVSMFTSLARNGWNFAINMELSKSEKGKDVLFFESGEVDLEATLFCMNFPKDNRIKVIGAPSEVINKIGHSIRTCWTGRGLQQGAPSQGESFEFKLADFPWGSGFGYGGDHREKKCKMMGMILKNLRALGYKCYASVKITKKEMEMPTLFFRKTTNVFK